MSVVYRAYDPSLDRHIALKLIAPWEDTSAFARLQREARAMAQLQHPNVAMVHEVGEHQDRCFIAMELIEGQTAKNWAAETARPWSEIVRIYLQAGRGLLAAHRAGLVHRDFKPNNVLVGDDGRVRVVDFGLARPVAYDPSGDLLLPADTSPGAYVVTPRDEVLADDTQPSDVTATGIISGTPAYMAPEQHAGNTVSPQSDQFSFAVSLWEALYRQRPFPGRTAFAVAHAIADGNISPPPHRSRVPHWVEQILRRSLSTDPDERFDSMGSMLAAFLFTWRVLYT
jgi:serine/threonine protein kinase